MAGMEKKAQHRRKFSREFKADIVKIIREGGRSVEEVAQEHKLHTSSIYGWLQQDRVDAGEGPPQALSTPEKEELSALRKEVRELRREHDFLRCATAYFAKDAK